MNIIPDTKIANLQDKSLDQVQSPSKQKIKAVTVNFFENEFPRVVTKKDMQK